LVDEENTQKRKESDKRKEIRLIIWWVKLKKNDYLVIGLIAVLALNFLKVAILTP